MTANIYIIILIGVVVLFLAAIVTTIIVISVSSNKKKKGISEANVENFIAAAGGLNNIQKATFNHSRLQLFVDDPNLIDSYAFKSLGATGVVKSGQKVTIIVGRLSQDIAMYINNRLK